MHKLSPEDLGVIRAGPTLKLPLPDTHCWDEDENIDVWSYSHEAMLKYASQVSEAMLKYASQVSKAQCRALELASTALETCTVARSLDLCIKDFDADLVSAAMEEIEIGELRAALKDRDAEIDRLKDINRSLVDKANRQNIHDARQSEVLTAQRKVLEQALEALEFTVKTSSWPERAQQMYVPAITAIQEVLHAN